MVTIKLPMLTPVSNNSKQLLKMILKISSESRTPNRELSKVIVTELKSFTIAIKKLHLRRQKSRSTVYND